MKRILTSIAGVALMVASTSAQQKSFVLDQAKSSITVNANATGGGFTGTLKNYQATISGDATTLKPSSAKVTWLFKDLDTKKAKRDAKMLKWLDVGKHPGGEFKLTRVFKKKVLGKEQSYALGTIKIHGVSKQLVFPINTLKNGNSLTISGQAVLDTTDFALPIIRMALIATVKPKITIDFTLVGTGK